MIVIERVGDCEDGMLVCRHSGCEGRADLVTVSMCAGVP